MNVTAVLRTLEAKGKASEAQTYRRHGVTGAVYGVLYSDLALVAKKLGTDHALALELWKSGVHDARVLSTHVASPEQLTGKLVFDWLSEVDNYVLTDAVAALAARAPGALGLARDLVKSKQEYPAAAGWNIFAAAAVEGRLEESEAKRLVGTIRREIHGARNRVRHAMNGALIAIGGSMPKMTELSLAAAHSIGRVEVSHGDTGCVTPEAAPYIQRMLAHAAKKGRLGEARVASKAPRAREKPMATKSPAPSKLGGAARARVAR